MEFSKKQIRNKLTYLKRSGQIEKYIRYLKRYRDVEDYIIVLNDNEEEELCNIKNINFKECCPEVIKKNYKLNNHHIFYKPDENKEYTFNLKNTKSNIINENENEYEDEKIFINTNDEYPFTPDPKKEYKKIGGGLYSSRIPIPKKKTNSKKQEPEEPELEPEEQEPEPEEPEPEPELEKQILYTAKKLKKDYYDKIMSILFYNHTALNMNILNDFFKSANYNESYIKDVYDLINKLLMLQIKGLILEENINDYERETLEELINKYEPEKLHVINALFCELNNFDSCKRVNDFFHDYEMEQISTQNNYNPIKIHSMQLLHNNFNNLGY